MLVLLAKWSPLNLNKDLYAIAYNESTYGKNVNHARSSRGRNWTAIGPLAVKPVTIYDTIRNTPHLKIKYGELTIDQIADALEGDDVFYYNACNAHWSYLRHTFSNDTSRMVYAWRWGITAAKEASWKDVAFDPYVIKYMDHRIKISRRLTK